MELSAEQIQENWNTLGKIVNKYISSPRRETVLELLEKLSDNIVLAPASGKDHFHNAFPGGYVDHVINVVKASLKTKQLWEEMGAHINFTDEELVFSALFHDFGKIGDGDKEGYIPQKDKWRQDKLNERFIPNTELPFMLIQDRSLYLLQKYGIQVSHNEYLAIRLHDGVFDDANKAYFVSYNPDSKFRTNIVNILHQADYLASKVEYDRWKYSGKEEEPTKKESKVKSSEGLKNLVKSL